MSDRERAGGRVVVLLILGLALLFGGGYAAAYYEAADRTALGTTAAGVGIGNLTQPQAVQALETGLRERAEAPITVIIEGRTHRITPTAAGLGVDYRATVAQAATERSWRLSRLWEHYAGGDELDPVITVDRHRLHALVARLERTDGARPRDGDIAFARDRIRVTQPRVGRRLDSDEVGSALLAAYLQDDPTAALALHDEQPDIDAADVQTAMTRFANPAMSGSVRLLLGKVPVRLQPREYAPVLLMRSRHGRLVPDVHERALRRLVGASVADVAPVDARVELVDGRPRVVKGRPGVTYHQRDVTDAFLTLVKRDLGKRSMKVRARVAQPEFSTKDARRLRIRERVSSFTTYFPEADHRNTTLRRAAGLVNGMVLEPRETFSLNRTVGKRIDEEPGGVSQLATTLFNAMYFAGLEDVERRAHLSYVDRYPVGRDAGVDWGSADLRFRNDTPYGVLVHAHVSPSTPSSQGVVTVSMWSTKYWDITSTTSRRYRVVAPKTQILHSDDCHPSAGSAGFEVDVTRHFRRHGRSAPDHDERFHTRYAPSDTVICR